jgi:hypothetical protein
VEILVLDGVNLLGAMELADQEGDDGMTEPEDEGKMTLSEDLVGKIKEMKEEKEKRNQEVKKSSREPGWGLVMVEKEKKDSK